MKRIHSFIIWVALYAFTSGIFACSTPSSPEAEQPGGIPETPPEKPTEPAGYTLQGAMKADTKLIDKGYADIHQYMRQFGFDYSEHPNSSEHDHQAGVHCNVIYDNALRQPAFLFMIHANKEVLDGDRGKIEDRQRNEMKSQTTPAWYKLNGNWDEWQRLTWKFKIPKGFRPSSSFCHIHQLKAQEGNNGSPLITITPRANADGSNRRIQVIHTGDTNTSTKGVLIDNAPLSEFEDEWIQVETEMHYTHNGYFSIKLTRISDSRILMSKSFENVDMWRKGATNIRNKFGIYRSFGKQMESADDRPTNGIKDESLLLADFEVYEKNTNADPQPHD